MAGICKTPHVADLFRLGLPIASKHVATIVVGTLPAVIYNDGAKAKFFRGFQFLKKRIRRDFLMEIVPS